MKPLENKGGGENGHSRPEASLVVVLRKEDMDNLCYLALEVERETGQPMPRDKLLSYLLRVAAENHAEHVTFGLAGGK